jgi:hypothetical protein
MVAPESGDLSLTRVRMNFLYRLIMWVLRKQYWYWKSQMYPKLEYKLDEEWVKRHPKPFDNLPKFPGW